VRVRGGEPSDRILLVTSRESGGVLSQVLSQFDCL